MEKCVKRAKNKLWNLQYIKIFYILATRDVNSLLVFTVVLYLSLRNDAGSPLLKENMLTGIKSYTMSHYGNSMKLYEKYKRWEQAKKCITILQHFKSDVGQGSVTHMFNII